MASEPIKRNRYSDPPLSEGNFSAKNFDEDFNEFHLPLNRMQLANFQEWGIAQGLEVSGSIDGTTLTVAPGVAVDIKGQLISLSPEGKGDIGSNPPSQEHDEVDVPVVLDLKRFAPADYYLTIQYSQILRLGEGPLGRYEHAPWVRLQSVDSFTNDGTAVILANVVIESQEEQNVLKELKAQGRRIVSKRVQRLLLLRPQLEGEKVEQGSAGLISARDNGLQVSVAKAEDEILLSQENWYNFSRLEVRANDSQFQGKLHVEKDLQVGDAETSSNLSVTGNANIGGNLTVSGNLEVTGNVTARDVEHVSGNVSFGDADNDEVKITGVLRSGHSSGALRVDDALHSTGSLTIDGSVGIGTNNPGSNKLKVEGNTAIAGDLLSLKGNEPVLEIRGQRDDDNATIQLRETDEGNYGFDLKYIGRTDNKFYIESYTNEVTQGKKHLTIERDSGNIGIGTTAPERSLHVRGDVIRLDRDATNPALMITRWSSGYEQLLRSFTVGVAANNTSEGYFYIANRNQTLGGAGAVENLVITQDGNVGIGTTNPTAKLDVNGDIKCIIGGNAYTISMLKSEIDTLRRDFFSHVQSDIRLKTNIEKEGNILSRLMKLEVKNYHWKDNAKVQTKKIGFIAQDVQPLFPYLVGEIKDEDENESTLTLKYAEFGVLAIGGLKELKTEMDTQIAKLKTEMNAEIKELKTQIQQLSNMVSKS